MKPLPNDGLVTVPVAVLKRATAKMQREYARSGDEEPRSPAAPWAPVECWTEVEALYEYIERGAS